MRVQLLVNLKIESGKVIGSGTIFDDQIKEFPEFVVDNLGNKKLFKEVSPAFTPAVKTAPEPVKSKTPITPVKVAPVAAPVPGNKPPKLAKRNK